MPEFFKRNAFVFAVAAFSLLSVWSLGYTLQGYFVGMICFWCALFNLNKTLFKIIFAANLLICALFAPIGMLYGRVSIGLIASALETHAGETREFLSTLPWQGLALGLAVAAAGAMVLYAAGRRQTTCFKNKNVLLLLIFAALVLHKPVTHTVKRHMPFDLIHTEVQNVNFYVRTIELFRQYREEKAQAENFLSDRAPWEIQSVQPKYQNFLLVIGESARADYLPTYGFPLDTSPYLAQTKGLVLENFISAAPNTQPSLSKMLHLNDGNNTVYSNSIISLAKSAGFETFWLSTQPTGDMADTAASRVGIQADVSKFYTPNAPRGETGKFSDFVLLEGLKKHLNQKAADKPGLFVFHINGSHPDFCKRLVQPVSQHFKSEQMSCYLETLKQTDSLLRQAADELARHGSYSMIYLSDHGLAHINQGSDSVSLLNSAKHKQAYHVPFVMISSDDTAQRRQKSLRSGFDFIYGFAQWLGIEERKLVLPYRFFSEDSAGEIRVFNWEDYVPYQSLQDDPALQP